MKRVSGNTPPLAITPGIMLVRCVIGLAGCRRWPRATAPVRSVSAIGLPRLSVLRRLSRRLLYLMSIVRRVARDDHGVFTPAVALLPALSITKRCPHRSGPAPRRSRPACTSICAPKTRCRRQGRAKPGAGSRAARSPIEAREEQGATLRAENPGLVIALLPAGRGRSLGSDRTSHERRCHDRTTAYDPDRGGLQGGPEFFSAPAHPSWGKR